MTKINQTINDDKDAPNYKKNCTKQNRTKQSGCKNMYKHTLKQKIGWWDDAAVPKNYSKHAIVIIAAKTDAFQCGLRIIASQRRPRKRSSGGLDAIFTPRAMRRRLGDGPVEQYKIAGKAKSLMFSLANTSDPHRHVAETRQGWAVGAPDTHGDKQTNEIHRIKHMQADTPRNRHTKAYQERQTLKNKASIYQMTSSALLSKCKHLTTRKW